MYRKETLGSPSSVMQDIGMAVRNIACLQADMGTDCLLVSLLASAHKMSIDTT